MLAIPSFYKRVDQATSETNELVSQVKAIARSRFLNSRSEECAVTEEEFDHFYQVLKECSETYDGAKDDLVGRTLAHDAFLALSRSDVLNAKLRQRIFTEERFWLFPRDACGNVYTACVFACVREMVEMMRLRCKLAEMDRDNSGHLSEMQLVAFFDEFVGHVPDEFRDVYLSVIVRKFMFFLEQNHRIPIRTLISSPIMLEFRDRERNDKSWFHADNIYRMYEVFIWLDVDRNGLLSEQEMLAFTLDQDASIPRTTQLVVQRLFAAKVSRSPGNPLRELDFRQFLDFVLAFQSKGNDVAVRYFWEVLDWSGSGYLDIRDINDLVANLFDTVGRDMLYTLVGGTINVSDVVNEIFDMATSGKATSFTLEDLNRSGHATTILNMLTDPLAFIDYEQRESKLQNQQQQQLQEDQIEYIANGGDEEAAAARIFGAFPSSSDDVAHPEEGSGVLSTSTGVNKAHDRFDNPSDTDV